MKAIMKYLSVTVLTLLCSAAWSFDFEEEFKKVLKDSVQKKIEEKSDAATSSALLGLVGISQEEEITIGRQIAGNLLGASALVKDQGLQSYVNNVGRWVASQSERPDLAWHFGVIESSDVNAFAAPGGYIFLTRGLYSLLQNEAELAGVLGHEIGHVIRKHHLKILQQSSLVDLGGKLISKRIGGNDKVQKLIGNGAEIVARSLDKNAEFEADRIAVVLAARAGYDAFALPEVLQKIGHFANDDGSVALLFKTHPLPDDRLEKLGLAMNDRLEDVKGKTLVARFYRIKP
ncbi:MAG: M48 family metalloprotease [Nitrosomonadales bacterium]|nr:M48 family metalloprotease [Nitrosomonadales bacterium]